MNNAAGTSPLTLSVFGGAVTEMAPSDLPEGASPFSQDMDFLPGSVFTRGGRANQMSYGSLFNENLAGLGTSSGTGTPWSGPNNLTRNITGTYASTTLGFGGSGSGIPGVDKGVTIGSAAVQTTYAFPATTPSLPNEWAAFIDFPGSGLTISQAGWTSFTGALVFFSQLFSGTATFNLSGTRSSTTYQSMLALFFTNGSTPANVQSPVQNATGTHGGSAALASPLSANTSILVVLQALVGLPVTATPTITDNLGNVYQIIGNTGDSSRQQMVAFCLAPKPGTPNVTVTYSDGLFNSSTVTIFELSNIVSAPSTLAKSAPLFASQFGLNIPVTQKILGMQLEVFGNQTNLQADAILTAQLTSPPTGTVATFSGQLPAADGTVTLLGTPTSNWGAALTAALLNSPSFSMQLNATTTGGELVTFNIYAVKLKVFLSPFPPANVNFLKTYEQSSGQTDTLVLDANGILWDENVTTALQVLNSIYTSINPGSFAKSVTFQNTEYIAFSNLLQGTDMPRQWSGTFLDRVSQVGPAAPPAFGSTSTGASIVSITQPTPYLLTQSANNWLLVSAGPSAIGSFGVPATPGNVMTIVLKSTDVPPAAFVVGSNIQISGFPTVNGKSVNNDPTGVSNPAYYTITSVGGKLPNENSYDWITFQIPFSTFYNQQTPAGCNIQLTVATLTASTQVPFLEVGNQFTLTGATPAGWNNTFRVTATPNASVLQIVNTSLTSNVAQYVFNLQSGTAPVVGQYVNVNGTLNGGGIFNVVKGVITAVSGSSFSLSIQSPNINGAAESNASGVIYGTVFLFDPAATVTNPIIGNAAAGGSIGTSGVVGVGIRRAVCIFKTRNSALTAPSPYVEFNVTGSASAIVASAIPIGPANVVARIIAFTGAGGGNYFWVPQPVTVTSNGQKITYPATIINDNVTTQATFSIPDAVLLSATAIDIQGNNLFAQIELGSCRGFLTYDQRVVAWGEQNKIQNLLNLSFDGGIGLQNLQQLATQPKVSSYPLGWTVDAVNGAGGSLVTSPLFGNSYYIKNSTGITQGAYGLIWQGAYANQLGTPIVQSSTAYSCRLAARSPSGAASGSLVVDFFSPVLNQVFNTISIPLASMTSNYQIFTGPMLVAKPLTIVPPDLIMRVWAFQIPNLGDVEIDRIEPFPTTQPTFSTQFHISYAGNPEAFDIVTGFCGPAQNQQKCNGGMLLFDSLYMLKERSLYSTSDNGVTEPNQWTWREVSNKVGTIGQNSYDYGEGWAVTACRPGLYFFEGGEPLKLSQEIQSVWDRINWNAGQTIWVRNDSTTKSIKIGVPIPTPNIFMPEFPVNANPTSPNVILQMSYRELNTGQELARTGPIRSSFSGRLLSPEPARKWSFWNIASPYGDFIDRGDNTSPLFFGSGYADNKVFAINAAQLHDDGLAINSFYLTHGFAKPELAEARGIGVLRAQLNYLTANVTGSGNLNTLVYPEDPRNPLPWILDSIPLDAIAQGDVEIGAGGLTGNRFFIRMGTNAVGAAFGLSTVTAAMSKDPWADVRGTFHGNAS